MNNVVSINVARHRRQLEQATQSMANVVRIEQVAERIARHRRALERLLQDTGLGWHHQCQLMPVNGMIPRGEACLWCGETEPTPPEAA